jgi:hypothetical protein
MKPFESEGHVDEKGNIERSLPIDRWHVPRIVETDGDTLLWTAHSSADYRYRSAGEGLLTQFIALEEGIPSEIRSYAQKWGVLYCCREHQLPASHDIKQAKDLYRTGFFNQCELDWFKAGGKIWYREPLSLWRQYAREARTILHVSSILYSGKLPEAEAWEKLFNDSSLTASNVQDVSLGKLFLTDKLRDWLDLAHVKILPYWGRGSPTVLFGSGRLFGALALQLCFVVARTEGIALCSFCGEYYLPKKRRPKLGQRSYCERCRKRGRPEADAARDYWRRKHKRRLQNSHPGRFRTP